MKKSKQAKNSSKTDKSSKQTNRSCKNNATDLRKSDARNANDNSSTDLAE